MARSDKPARGRPLIYMMIPVGFVLIIAVLFFIGWFSNPQVDVPLVDDPAGEEPPPTPDIEPTPLE